MCVCVCVCVCVRACVSVCFCVCVCSRSIRIVENTRLVVMAKQLKAMQVETFHGCFSELQ